MEKNFSKVSALILTTILCASFIPATSAQESTEHYAFGMEYNYSNLNDDFESMSGLPLDNILADIMQSADDAGMDMVILEQTTGVSTMVVDQYMDGVETWTVDGASIEMTRHITDLTIRNGALSDIALVTEWSDSYAGWDLTFTYDSDGVMNIDATYVEYRDASGLVYGYDTTMSGSMSANSDFGIYGSVNGEDAADVLPLNIELSLGFEYDVTSASSQIRLEEPSTLNNDLANLNPGEEIEWELLESGYDNDYYEYDWRDYHYVYWINANDYFYNIDNFSCMWDNEISSPSYSSYICEGWYDDHDDHGDHDDHDDHGDHDDHNWFFYDSCYYDADRMNDDGEDSLYWCYNEGEEDYEDWWYWCEETEEHDYRCTDDFGHGNQPEHDGHDDHDDHGDDTHSIEYHYSSVDQLYDNWSQVLETEGTYCVGCEGELENMVSEYSFDITNRTDFEANAGGYNSYYFQFIDENDNDVYDDDEIYAISCEAYDSSSHSELMAVVAYNGVFYNYTYEDFWQEAYAFHWNSDDDDDHDDHDGHDDHDDHDDHGDDSHDENQPDIMYSWDYCEYYESSDTYWCTDSFGQKEEWQNSLTWTHREDGTMPDALEEFDTIYWIHYYETDNASCEYQGWEFMCTYAGYDYNGDGDITEDEYDYNYHPYCEYYSNDGGMYYCTHDFGWGDWGDTLDNTNYADRIIPEMPCNYCDYADIEIIDLYDSVSGDFATSTSFDFSLTGLPAEEFGFPEGDWDLTASDSATDSGTFDESNMELDLDECGHIEFELHEGSQMITQDDGSQIEVLQAHGLPIPMPMFCQVAHLTGTALIGSDDGTTIGDLLEDQLDDLFLSDLETENQDGYDEGIYMSLQDSSESQVELYVEHCCSLDYEETYEVSVVLEDSNGVTTDTTSWVVSGDSYFGEEVDLDVTGWGEYCATVEVKQIDEANPMLESKYCFTVDQQMEPSEMIIDIAESFEESTLENVLEIFGDNLENRMDNYEADFAYNDGDAYVLWDPVTNQIVGFQVLVTDYEELDWIEWGYCEWEGDDWNGDDMWYCADSEQAADSYGFDDYWYYCEFVESLDEDEKWRCTDDLGRSSNHESSSTGTQYLDSIDNEEVWWTLIGPESDEYAPAPDALSVSYFSGVQAIAVEQAVEDSSSLDDLVNLDLHDTSALDLAIEEGGDAPSTGSSDEADETVTEDLEEGLLPFVSPAMTIVVVALAGLVASLRTRRD